MISQTPPATVSLQINGQSISVPQGTTIIEAAAQLGTEIPSLCHDPKLSPVGVCRMCVVDVGERVLAPSCMRECTEGMNVVTHSETIENHRRTLLEFQLHDHPTPCTRETTTGDCELEALGRAHGLMDDTKPKAANSQSQLDISSPVIAVDHSACILCDRCIRACDDIQHNDIIGRTHKGHATRIGFDLNQPMGESDCVSCGECAAACPTGALTHKQAALPIVSNDDLETTGSVCSYCGVGCATSIHVHDGKIQSVDGRESVVNDSRLCVKGRYGWDYTQHAQRLTTPLMRRDDYYPKQGLSSDVKSSLPPRDKKRRGGLIEEADILAAFKPVSWEEALDFVAQRLLQIKQEHGSGALAGFGSAKCSNEEAYLFQKIIRAGLGTNNVDHCTRLCHASSVAALMETIGSGAVTNVFRDVENADVALVTGSNATANHPVAATFMKQAAAKGTELIVVDVRDQPLTRYAKYFAQIKPETDVAFYNGVMHYLIDNDLIDKSFIESRTEGFDALSELVLSDYSPSRAAQICGIKEKTLIDIAQTIGQSKQMMIFWGMGIAQHTTGTNNARCLISLCLMTGNMGRPGTGLHPLRGQNNVQGASDAGLIPIVYPDYQAVGSEAVRKKFEAAWGVELDPNPGLTVVEIMDGALEKQIRGMYIMGENPFISDPNSNKVRAALQELDLLAVQDIFLTETAEFADIILPAGSYYEKTGTYTNTDRRVQLGRKAIESPGDARPDWEILCQISQRIGMEATYESPSDIFDEFAGLTRNYSGLSYDALETGGKLWPYLDPEAKDGEQVLFSETFPTANGKGKFVACDFHPAEECSDDAYPFVLSTGRLLEHWHTGSMTRRSEPLSTIEPDAFVAINPHDLETINASHNDWVRVASRRGEIELQVRADPTVLPGNVFIPFHFREAAANVLTNDALDPFGKIPGFKYCAVRIEAVQPQPSA